MSYFKVGTKYTATLRMPHGVEVLNGLDLEFAKSLKNKVLTGEVIDFSADTERGYGFVRRDVTIPAHAVLALELVEE